MPPRFLLPAHHLINARSAVDANAPSSLAAVAAASPSPQLPPFSALYLVLSALFTSTSADHNDGDSSNTNTLLVGCTVGVISAATQSLGLTLQRKSHIDNDARAPHLRRPAPRRAMWRAGVLLFLVANIVGSSVQITTLPLIVLSPLQAVGLVFNSLCAAWVLHEPLTIQSVFGTLLVAIGALIVAAWGVVSESAKPHNLDELLRLLRRPQFLVWMAVTLVIVSAVLFAISHRSLTPSDSQATSAPVATPIGSAESSNTTVAMDSTSNNNNLNTNSINNVSCFGNDSSAKTDAHDAALPPSQAAAPAIPKCQPQRPNDHSGDSTPTSILEDDMDEDDDDELELGEHDDGDFIDGTDPADIPPKQRLINGLLYAVVCGILSAHSLLMAKSAVEILVRAFVDGKTQDLRHYQSWLIVLAFLGFAVSQLVFMNRGLRLCSTAVLYPLVFCVFNVASILNSLIYFQQTAEMSALQAFMVALGTLLILAGVMGLSWHLGWHDTLALSGVKIPKKRALNKMGRRFKTKLLTKFNHLSLSSAASAAGESCSGSSGTAAAASSSGTVTHRSSDDDCDSAATFVGSGGLYSALNTSQDQHTAVTVTGFAPEHRPSADSTETVTTDSDKLPLLQHRHV